MAKLGQGIVRHGMAEGVAIVTYLPMGWQKVEQGMAEGIANLTTLPTGSQNSGMV